ncbi:DNA cytosine methyltransferase [Embleya sp. NBC_00896]|uniref:DNA cytosine methyltransferase n=1 Tax=Embleya sp. NBC_00896 TaxID=2975961 RepID=UPI00386747B2|nr:DNA cytosine methyltransferase [Embleya sp. NBC_00896]
MSTRQARPSHRTVLHPPRYPVPHPGRGDIAEEKPAPWRIGSLCSGIGALDLAVADALDATVAWHCQYDTTDRGQHAARVLARHWPDIPNHADIRTVDWARVEAVDVVTAGFPCQSVSAAGPRTGLAAGAASGLWIHVARALHTLRPRLRMVVIENVPGLRWTHTDDPMGPRPARVGNTDRASTPRALGAVLGDLADLGLDAEWTSLAASAVGAPHRRDRVFILAWPRDRPPDAPHPPWRTTAGTSVVAHPDRLPLRT